MSRSCRQHASTHSDRQSLSRAREPYRVFIFHPFQPKVAPDPLSATTSSVYGCLLQAFQPSDLGSMLIPLAARSVWLGIWPCSPVGGWKSCPILGWAFPQVIMRPTSLHFCSH